MERMNSFGGNDKSSEAFFGNSKPKELTALSPAPIQDDDGNLTFTLEGETYSLNVNSEKEREKVKREVNINSLAKYNWFREGSGKRHWVLYNTEMYEVKETLTHDKYIHYKENSNLAPIIPINATSCYLMFACLQNLTTIDFSHFCTNNVITMELMFNYSEKLNTLDLSSFDTSSVTDMNFMFCDCKSLTQLNLSSFSTENVKYLNSMFENCVSLWKLDLSSFSTKSAMHFTKTFAGCENLYHIDVSYKWILNEDAENNEVFNDCYRLPHYRDSRLGTEMFCSVNEGGYFHYVGEEDDYE